MRKLLSDFPINLHSMYVRACKCFLRRRIGRAAEAECLKLFTQFIVRRGMWGLGTMWLPLRVVCGLERIVFHEDTLLVALLDAGCYSATFTGIIRSETGNTCFLCLYNSFQCCSRLSWWNDALHCMFDSTTFPPFHFFSTQITQTHWSCALTEFHFFRFGSDFMHAVCSWCVICSFTTLPSKMLSHSRICTERG